MNKIIISGNVVEKPELTTTSNGIQTATMRIAVPRRFAKEPTSDFFNVKVWRTTAEFCNKYLEKGSKVIVTGSLIADSYTTKDGEKKTAIYIMGEDVESIGGGKPKEEKKFIEEDTEPNDLPF